MIGKRMIAAGFVLVFLLGMAFARVTAQTGSNIVFDEGQEVDPEAAVIDQAFPALATTPGTHYRTYSGGRFFPTGSTLTYAPIGGAIYATSLQGAGFSLSLDLDLPDGATITEVVFFVVDNATNNLDLSLRSYNPETNAFVTHESATSTGASTALQTIILPVSPPVVVNNTTTAYRLRVAPGTASSAHLLRGARVGFTVPTGFLPLITR